MGSGDQLLAIDVGTQSVRALLFDPRGAPVASGRVPIEPYVSPQPGWAEQDPEVWWAAIGDACRLLWSDPAARPDAVAGVALTTQRVTIVVADEDGRPLRPAIVWLDQRQTDDLPAIGGAWGLAFRAARVRETVARFQADCEANWIERFEPSVWRRIRRYGVLSSWLTARLVGQWVDSSAAQVGYLPFDFKRSRWAGRLDWKWQVANFDRAWLPELVAPTGHLGELTADGRRPPRDRRRDAPHRVGGRQAGRGPRGRRRDAGRGGALVRDDGIAGHDTSPLPRGDPARAPLPRRDSGRVVRGAAGPARLLDGRVVQA